MFFNFFVCVKISLGEAVLTSTHNLCFGAKIRKIDKPLHTPVLLYKSAVQGVYISRTCFPDMGIEQRLHNFFENVQPILLNMLVVYTPNTVYQTKFESLKINLT